LLGPPFVLVFGVGGSLLWSAAREVERPVPKVGGARPP
jgi:hypothetical protein